jgi:Bacterial PH domain
VYYQPPRALGLLVGAVLALWSSGVAILLFNFGLTSDIRPIAVAAYAGAMAALGLALVFAYWTYALATLAYSLDRNGLVITWGATRQVIPLQAIERLVPGTAVGVPHVQGVSWLGYHIGKARIARIGEVLFYSTHQAPEQVLYVMTSERNYAISVEDPADFARHIQIRLDLGPTAEVTHHVERSGASLQSFWNDRIALVLSGVAIAAGAAVWAAVALRWAGLPAVLELHFPPTEQLPLVEVVGRGAILELPRVASMILAINLVIGVAVHTWERVASYVLLIAATVVQVAFIAALEIALRGV